MLHKSESIKELATALSKFQEEVKNPANTSTNPQFKSRYAPLDTVINAIKPILAKHGLSFIQSTGSQGESISIQTMLIHESGEWLETEPLILPAYQTKGGGVKEFNAQGAGSSITYGRRYQLSALLGISSEDDDDGNSTSVQTSSAKPDPAEAERRKQEAIEKAKKAAAGKEKNDSKPPFEPDEPAKEEEAAAEPITEAQKKAIANLAKIIGKKREDFSLDELIQGMGKSSLDEMSGEDAKAMVTEMNKLIKTK